MTPREFQENLEYQIDTVDELKDVKRTSDVIQYWLNEARNTFIRKRYRNFQQGIKKNQREVDEIRTLLVKNTTLLADNALTGGHQYVWDLPANYDFLVADRSCTTWCGNQYDHIQNRQITAEELGEMLHSTHHKPKWDSPLSEIIDDQLYVYRDLDLTFTINTVIIDYIRQDTIIDVITGGTNTILDPSVHADIVSLAVTLMTEAVRAGTFESKVAKDRLTEVIK